MVAATRGGIFGEADCEEGGKVAGWPPRILLLVAAAASWAGHTPSAAAEPQRHNGSSNIDSSDISDSSSGSRRFAGGLLRISVVSRPIFWLVCSARSAFFEGD